VAFQPHLYSRTHDFAEGFAQSLSMADTLLLLPIYPARELPMPGVTSEWLLTMMPPLMDAKVVQKSELVKQVSDSVAKCLSDSKSVVVMTLGAGDIDRLVGDIKQNLNIYE
jgi:UDP-N-acetylmuramate--alanine ligase